VISGPENFFDQIYVYAWFTGFLLAGGLHLVGAKWVAPRSSAQPAAT
jgi:cytosine/uracil/thiamine/allantoin permease